MHYEEPNLEYPQTPDVRENLLVHADDIVSELLAGRVQKAVRLARIYSANRGLLKRLEE